MHNFSKQFNANTICICILSNKVGLLNIIVVFTVKKSNFFLLRFDVFFCDFRSIVLIQSVKMKKKKIVQSHM